MFLLSSILVCSILSDIDVYAKNTCMTFSGTEKLALWEKISLCSDVMEGAWYLLYDEQKKPSRQQKVKRLIRESIDNLHSTLVSDSKISISLAVFGPLGAGKSFFLNCLLNWGLGEYSVQNGPLPSARGSSQTPIPIYVKYGKNVKVLMHKRETGVSPDEWFQPEELGSDTLARVKDTLKAKFKDTVSLSHANCVELLGPFPIFNDLKNREMTASGHLELDTDVEFVDVPGYGDEIGNESVNIELSKADVVLFFDSGKSGRPVSSEDIAQVFRRREKFSFVSRPKLVHVVNDRQESSIESSFDRLCEQKRKDLERAWSSFLSSSVDYIGAPSCYKDVLAKLPLLNGKDLLDKLSEESDVIYFDLKYPDLRDSLKHVIDDHINSVKIKQRIHPFLQDVHWTAKKLRKRIGQSLTTEKKKRQTRKAEVKEGQVNFEFLCNGDQVSDLVDSFVDQATLPLDLDIQNIYQVLNIFLNSHETVEFLLESLKSSLHNYKHRLIEAYTNDNWSTNQDIPGGLIDLVEILCTSRVKQFCANTARTYLTHVLGKVNRLPLSKYKKRWSRANADEKKDLCKIFLDLLLKRTRDSLMKQSRDKQFKKSHFHLMQQLKEDVTDMFAVGSLEDNANRPDLLELLQTKLDIVIQFCRESIRDINPHPSLDVPTDPSVSLPETMTSAHDDKPVQSKHGEIIKEVTELLMKPSTKGADAIRKIESRLSIGKNALALRESQSAEKKRFWAKVLLNVLSDKDHFNVPLDDRLILPLDDPESEKLVKQARKRLFAHQKSFVTCKIVTGQDLPDNELHLRRSSQEEYCLEVLVSSKVENDLNAIREEFKDPMQQLAPIFIPTIRPGPTADIRGNFFLEEDPWSNDVREDEDTEHAGNIVDGGTKESKSNALALNIFLVVEKQHLETIQSTIESLEIPKRRNMIYIVLPQQRRGIGVTRAIIKSLAECLKFHLYWTVDDDIQFMFQFDGNARKWRECSITRGLLFGQRVFQTCLKTTVKELSEEEIYQLLDDVTKNWPDFAKKAKTKATFLLIDKSKFVKVQKNPSLLHSPFVNISEECGRDVAKEEMMKACEQTFVDECKKRLFEDAINHIAGVSLAHESTKKYDYMSKYPSADYMLSDQRYQVVLNNTDALKERNYVTDEVIFHPDENQITDIDKRNTPYWGIRGADKSFSRALTVGGIVGYQVIRVVHSHKKLINAFDRVGPSYIGSQSPYRSEDEEDMETES